MPEEIASNHINLSSDEKLVQSPPEQQSQVVAPCRLPPSGRHVRMHFECLADEGANQRWQQEKEEVKQKQFWLLVRMSLSNLYHSNWELTSLAYPRRDDQDDSEFEEVKQQQNKLLETGTRQSK